VPTAPAAATFLVGGRSEIPPTNNATRPPGLGPGLAMRFRRVPAGYRAPSRAFQGHRRLRFHLTIPARRIVPRLSDRFNEVVPHHPEILVLKMWPRCPRIATSSWCRDTQCWRRCAPSHSMYRSPSSPRARR